MKIRPWRQTAWWNIWKSTVKQSQTNAACVTLHPIRQAIWEDIWWRTLEENRTNAPSVNINILKQAICGNIWKYTMERRQNNATSVNIHASGQTVWGRIWAKISLVMDTFENVLLFSDLIKIGTSTNCLCQVGSILRLHKNPKTLLHCIFSSWVINRFDALVMDILQNLKNRP